MKGMRTSWFPVLLGIAFLLAFLGSIKFQSSSKEIVKTNEGWQAPDINLLPDNPESDLIHYGRKLIVNTSYYLGPRGTVAQITNGMDCQNCHVFAGTKSFGSSFALVSSTYPQVRKRSGKLESVEFRVNDCLQRSLNGKPIDSLSKEMRAMVAYLKWIGKDVKADNKPVGSGIIDIPYMNRAADPSKGEVLYQSQCSRCHGTDGEGVFRADSSGYMYPPVWGPHSYNTGAGLYRISRLAAFIRYNMPFDLALKSPTLSDEEAWDLAAFISSKPRDDKKFAGDWPKLETKPPDYPFGPYVDSYSEQQHKFGPFGPIKDAISKSTSGNK